MPSNCLKNSKCGFQMVSEGMEEAKPNLFDMNKKDLTHTLDS